MPGTSSRTFDAESLLLSLVRTSRARSIGPRTTTVMPLLRVARAELDAGMAELEPAVETALCSTVAEALTNVDRYAGATHATVRVRQDGDAVEVEIEDDGCGGADRTRGSGLRGLEDRLGTVGGVLEVASQPGGGTRLRAHVPLR